MSVVLGFRANFYRLSLPRLLWLQVLARKPPILSQVSNLLAASHSMMLDTMRLLGLQQKSTTMRNIQADLLQRREAMRLREPIMMTAEKYSPVTF